MEFQHTDFSYGTKGEDVALLHKILSNLGYKIDSKEIEDKYFGESTFEAVINFQLQYDLSSTGEVDEDTANKLLSLYQEKELKEPDKKIVDNGKEGNKDDNKDATVKTDHFSKLKNPEILLKPDILYDNLNKLKNKEPDFIDSKLNDQLHTQILLYIGNTSDAMSKSLKADISKIDYQKLDKDSNLLTVVQNVLDDLKKENSNDKGLLNELSEIQIRIDQNKQQQQLINLKIKDLLYLDTPLNQNPLFSADIQKTKVNEFAKISNLNDEISKKLIEKNIYMDGGSVDETLLSELVKEGAITDEQHNDLQLTVALGNLTGDNIEFISALKTDSIKSVADFVSWDKDKWKKQISDKNIPLPPNETADTFVNNIMFNIESIYPSQVMLSRIVNPARYEGKLGLIDSVHPLLENNDKIIDGKNPVANIKWNDKDVNQENQKKKEILKSLTTLDTFNKNNPDLDLRFADFFDSNSKVDWKDISDEGKKMVRKQMMSYQRVLNLADDTDARQKLLGKGYDSTKAIIESNEDEFVISSDLDKGKARLTYAKAKVKSISISM